MRRRFPGVGERSSRKAESVEFEAALHRAFEVAGISDRLHLLGNRNDVHLLLNEVDVLVHPAHQEPFGRVLLEASADGVPIVATDVGGTSEIIVDGMTGLLVPRADPKALAMSVVRILTDREAADRLGKAARQRAVDHFSISATSVAYQQQCQRSTSPLPASVPVHQALAVPNVKAGARVRQ